jgi:hypothetical protein
MSSLNNLVIQENEHYQLILSNFLNSLDNLDLFPKSRKSYFLPYNTLLPLLEETELFNNIQRIKGKKKSPEEETLKKELINVLLEKHNVLSSILEKQINQHNVLFTRILDRFEDFSPNVIAKTAPPIKKKKVRFAKEEVKSKPTPNSDKELPVFAKILLQSNNYSKFTVQHQPFTFSIKEHGDQVDKIISIIYHLIFHQIYNCKLRIIKKGNFDMVKQKELENELYKSIGIDDACNIENMIEYLECVKNTINFTSDFHLINIPLWDSCLANFINKSTSDEDFCKTTIFKSMYKTWFPWCKNPKEFLELVKISKKIKHLNPIWYNTVFGSDNFLSKKMLIQDLFVIDKWKKLSVIKRLYIALYAKMFGEYVIDYSIFPQFNEIVKQYSHNINNPIDIMKSFFNVNILSSAEKISHICDNSLCIWDVILVIEQDDYTIVSLTDEDEVIHISKTNNTYSLLNNMSNNYYKEWINKWSKQFWPSWDEVKHSYMNFGYIVYPIVKKNQSFHITEEISVSIIDNNDVEAYRKAFSILRAWPEVNHEPISLEDLVKNGYITNIKDILKFLILEKKLFYWISNTNAELWIYEVDSGFKSKYNDVLLRCSSIYSLKTGWNLDISPFLSIKFIEELNIDPETACYIYIRLNDLFYVKESARNIYVSNYTKLFKQPTISKRVSNMNLISLIHCPILSFNNFDFNFLDRIIHYYTNGLNDSLLKLYGDQSEDFIIKEEDTVYYSSIDAQSVSTTNTRNIDNFKTKRPLPYPVILKEESVRRLGFYGCEGDATKNIGNGRFIITIHKGNRTAKLCPIKDFQWNDARYIEDTKTNEEFEEKKDKYLPSLQADSSGDSIQRYRINKTKYYKPDSLDKDFRATYYDLFHPYSKNSIVPFIDFLNIDIDSELQNAFYDFVTSKCLNGSCILYRFCNLLWDIYIRHDIPEELTYLNREIKFDYRNLVEKIKSFSIACGQELSNESFNIIMKHIYKKQKWHCIIFSPIDNFKEFK